MYPIAWCVLCFWSDWAPDVFRYRFCVLRLFWISLLVRVSLLVTQYGVFKLRQSVFERHEAARFELKGEGGC